MLRDDDLNVYVQADSDDDDGRPSSGVGVDLSI